jgi:pullulanase
MRAEYLHAASLPFGAAVRVSAGQALCEEKWGKPGGSRMTLPTLFHITEQLGAVQIGGDEISGQVQFRLFFPAGSDPEIEEIRVAGNFQGLIGGTDWDFAGGPLLEKASRAEGTFWTLLIPNVLPAEFYQYKYQVSFSDGTVRKVTDPLARYSGSENQNAGFVIGGSRPEDNVVAPLVERKALRDLVVYEMHPGDFTDEFRGVGHRSRRSRTNLTIS